MEPDSNRWYTKPVSFSFTGDDGGSGVASCTSGTYSGPDGGNVTVSGSCTDNAGNTGSTSLTIKYDSTPPTVTGTPARQPDANGWYNHAVDVAFTGADGARGSRSAVPPSPTRTGREPREARRPVSRRRRPPERADERSSSGTTARRLCQPNVKWVHTGESISLSWTATKDVVRVQVMRAPGLSGKATPIYTGKAKRFVDRKLRTGTRYWYEVAVFDQAGNRAAATVGLRPPVGIYSPAEGAVVTKPPLVEWSPVRRARFWRSSWRGKVKLLTTWVRSPRMQLRQTWTMERPTPVAHRRPLPAVRVAGVRDGEEARVRQAARPGAVRRQGCVRRGRPGLAWPPGRVWVNSTEAAQRTSGATVVVALASSSMGVGTKRCSSRSLLDSRQYLERHLRDDGFTVFEAGVDVARSRPRRAGVARRGDRGEADLCRRLRAGERADQDRNVPVIVLTEPDADPVVRVRALESGADDVVPRDVYLELLARVRALLRRAVLGQADVVEVARSRSTTAPGRSASTGRPSGCRAASSSWPPSSRRPDAGLHEDRAPARRGGIRATGIRTRTVDSHASRLRRKLEAAGASDVVVNDWGWAIGCSLATPRPVS